MRTLSSFFFFFFILMSAQAQSITSADGTILVEVSDIEKAVKISAAAIKSKTNSNWSAEGIIWKVSYEKNSRMYTLYKGGVSIYQSSTISAIRGRYASDLLGVDTKIQ